MFCTHCGKEIDDNAVVCIHCGCAVNPKGTSRAQGKGFVETYLLCWFLGYLGLHRFYTGYIGIGVAQLLTLGGCGIWTLIDFISLSFNKFKDAEDKELSDYNKVLGMVGFGFWVASILLSLFVVFIMFFAIIAASTMN